MLVPPTEERLVAALAALSVAAVAAAGVAHADPTPPPPPYVIVTPGGPDVRRSPNPPAHLRRAAAGVQSHLGPEYRHLAGAAA
jgi:hypothetical protein